MFLAWIDSQQIHFIHPPLSPPVSTTLGRSRRHVIPHSPRIRPAILRPSQPRQTEAGDRQATESAACNEASLPIWKRFLDLSLILFCLPLVLVLSLALVCWIRLVSPGSVLFRQTRVGRGGQPFTIYKFRSMGVHESTSCHEAHVEHLISKNRPMAKLDFIGDSRLIKGGSFIRMSGLDELPQLMNVLKGEMSLVGPRPCLEKEFALYTIDQRSRFAIQPGLTGLWQVRRSAATTFRQMVKMDDTYVTKSSLLLDLQIILQTPLALIGQMKSCARAKALRQDAPEKTEEPLPSFLRN